MKKYIALFLALIMSLSLCACGSTTTNSTQKDPETSTTSDKATDENGTLNAPSVNSEKNRKDTTNYGDPADLSKPNEVIDCFKKTPVASEDSSNLGFAMVNTDVYTDDTIPTYDSVISNMITDAKYSYDAENQTVKITGDMDAASMRVMFRYLGISDSNSPDDFGGYDSLRFSGEWYIYQINSEVNGIQRNGSSVAVLDEYGEDGEWVFDMITLCSEMKKGTLDWDNAAEIYEAYNTACVRENQEWLREQNGVEY